MQFPGKKKREQVQCEKNVLNLELVMMKVVSVLVEIKNEFDRFYLMVKKKPLPKERETAFMQELTAFNRINHLF